jgi:hypothetical protein
MATPMPRAKNFPQGEGRVVPQALASTGKVDQAYGGAYLTEGFRHHNPRYPGETDALAKAMKHNADEHPNGCTRSSAPWRMETSSRRTPVRN